MLLECFSGDVEGKIVRVDDASNESQIAGHHIIELIGDKHAANVQLKEKQDK